MSSLILRKDQLSNTDHNNVQVITSTIIYCSTNQEAKSRCTIYKSIREPIRRQCTTFNTDVYMCRLNAVPTSPSVEERVSIGPWCESHTWGLWLLDLIISSTLTFPYSGSTGSNTGYGVNYETSYKLLCPWYAYMLWMSRVRKEIFLSFIWESISSYWS